MGTKEPYRMFTSRAEYRLLLREDNADVRLTEKGRQIGLVGDEQWAYFQQKMNSVELEKQRLKSQWIHPKHESLEQLNGMLKTPISREHSLEGLIRRPEMTYAKLTSIESLGPSISDPKAAEQVEIQIKYAGYIERQKDEVAKSLSHENSLLPIDFNFSQISGLSNEVVAKLTDARPETIGKASRISGITPAAISLLVVYLKKHSRLYKAEKKTA